MKMNNNPKTTHLDKLIFNNMLRSTFLSLLTITIFVSILIMFSFGTIKSTIRNFTEDNILSEVELSIDRETRYIEDRLEQIAVKMEDMQIEHELFFESYKSQSITQTNPKFGVHSNGAYYKYEDNGGSSLYYSSDTTMNDYAYEKAFKTEQLDKTFKILVENDNLIQQVYINTWDNMNRLYPFMNDAPGQYGPTLVMNDYNFYYLADALRNPEKQPVWTKAYLDPAGMGWMISCIVPVYNNGFLEGVTGADITLEIIVDDLLNIPLPFKSSIMIADQDGDLVAINQAAEDLFNLDELKKHTYSNSIDYTIYKPDSFNLSKQGVNSFGSQLFKGVGREYKNEMLEVGSDKYLVQNTVITDTGWNLFIVTDYTTIDSEINKVSDIMDRVIIVTSILLFILLLLSFAFIVRQSRHVADLISKPISALEMATKSLGNKVKTVDVSATTNIKEIDKLINQYNKMVHEIDDRTDRLINEEIARKLQKERADKYEIESRIDQLTQLFNRRKIDDTIDDEITRSKETGNPLTIILADIDFFKKVNDTFGHQIGDDVLKEFSRLLKLNIKSTDIVGRWGGEEFLIVCPYTNLEEGVVLAEKLRVLIMNYSFATQVIQTASFGVAEFQGEDRRVFFNKVDTAMYQAKSESRNTVVAYK